MAARTLQELIESGIFKTGPLANGAVWLAGSGAPAETTTNNAAVTMPSVATSPDPSLSNTLFTNRPLFDPPLPGTSLPNLITNHLRPGRVHEWFFDNPLCSQPQNRWHAPLHILTHTVASLAATTYKHSCGSQLIFWLGERCWPTPTLLAKTFGDLSWQTQCVFVNPTTTTTHRKTAAIGRNKNLEILLEIARSPLTLAVVADGNNIPLATLRRLQFAARKTGALVLLARPPWETAIFSCAETRWRVTPAPAVPAPAAPVTATSCADPPNATSPSYPLSPGFSFCFSLELFKAPALVASKTWFVEWHEDQENHPLHLSSTTFAANVFTDSVATNSALTASAPTEYKLSTRSGTDG